MIVVQLRRRQALVTARYGHAVDPEHQARPAGRWVGWYGACLLAWIAASHAAQLSVLIKIFH